MQLRSAIALFVILLLPLGVRLAPINNPVPVTFNPATYSVTEGKGAHVVITLQALTSHNYSFTVIVATRNGSALDGPDYRGTEKNLTFPAGTNVINFTVVIVDDDVNECSKDFFLDLEIPPAAAAMGVVKGSNHNGTVTITDEQSVPCQVTDVSLEPKPPMKGQAVLLAMWATPRSDVNITQYLVQYRRHGTDFWGSEFTVAGTSHSPPVTCAVLTGLDAGTEYNVRVRAKSGNEEGEWSEVKTTRTYDSGPDRVTGVSVTANTMDLEMLTLRVYWTTPRSDSNITEYQVEYRTSGTMSWINATIVSVIPPENYTILTELDVGIDYDIRVRAVSEFGAGTWSEVWTGGTPSIVPNVSVTETVESGKTTSVNVTWTTPKSDVNITEYQVQYRKNGTDSWNNATVVSGFPPPTFVVLTGLDPGTEYAIRVRAVSAVGVVGFWHYGTVRTMDDADNTTTNATTGTPPPTTTSVLTITITVYIAIASVLGGILVLLVVVSVVAAVVCLKRKQRRRKRETIGGDYVPPVNNDYVDVPIQMRNLASIEIEMTSRRALPDRPPEAQNSDHDYYNSSMESSPRTTPERPQEAQSNEHEYYNSSMETSRETSPDSRQEARSGDHEYYNSDMDNLPFALPRSHNELDESQFWAPVATVSGLKAQMRRNNRHCYKVQAESITFQQELGGGEFGVVYKGEWMSSPQECIQVAIKSLRSQDEEGRYKLLKEAAIMGQFSHPNVVRFYGVIDRPNKVILIMEFLSRGDLLNHLIKCRSISVHREGLPLQLLGFCQEIVGAMEYLSKKGFIHRDLAARNILLTEDCVAKIADFGMSHDMNDNNYYKARGGMIPVKWTAPEAVLYRKFSTKSDVWSYGMVMYEIWSLGHKPFEEFDINRVLRAFETGFCQPPPPGCPRNVYKLMVDCWNPDHHSRPTFEDLTRELARHPEELLSWSEQDRSFSSKAAVLGAPLQEGRHLYPELQHMY